MALKIREELGGGALMTDNDYNRKMKHLDGRLADMVRGRSLGFAKGKRSLGKTKHTYKKGPKAGKTEYVVADKVNESIYLTAGDVSGIGVKIQRHGVFQEYGVSNGHPITGRLRAKNDFISKSMREVEPDVSAVAAEYAADKVVRILSFTSNADRVENLRISRAIRSMMG